MTKIKYIESELTNLDIQRGSDAWIAIYRNASAASDILSKKELKQLIADMLEQFPLQTWSK